MADTTIPDWAQDSAAPAIPDWAQDSAAPAIPDWAADPAGATTAPTGPSSKPFKDEDFPEYVKLVKARTTTPAVLTKWMIDKGYGKMTNASDILTSVRRAGARANIQNIYQQIPAADTPPAPNGMPQPGTPTDWLPDEIQGPIERIGLSLGIIDPKTYYGPGNYGPNARAPNIPTTVSNPALPSWGDRFVRSMSETFDPAGSGVNAYILRNNKDIADDDAIRHYGSHHNWTGAQVDAAIKEAQRQRAAAYTETRSQRAIRDNDEVRRAEGLGVDPVTGEARSSWSGSLSRGSADLAGSIVGDANPTYALAPAGKPVVAGLEALAERLAPGVVSKTVTAAAPIVGRAAGQGAVQATTNLVTQADEVSHGMKDKIDPVEVTLRGAGGAGFQGGAEFLGKLTPALSKWIVGKIKEPSALDRMVAEGFDPADLPPGVSPKDAMAAITQLRGIRDEAVTFKGTPETTPAAPEPAATVAEPGPTDMTPQPSQAEFSPNPEPTAPGPAPISKKEADAQFEAAKGTFPVAAKTPEGWTEHYHGSPYDFENLSSDFTSYGEGTQNEGSGHYLTESPGIADWYQDQNSAGKGGYSYKVAVKDGDFIEFDKPVAEQSKAVQNTLNKYRVFNGIELWKENPGSSLTAKFALNRIENIVFDGDKKAVSKALNEDGLTGIKYLDGNHRSIGDGKKNVVVFNDADVKVTAKKKGLDGKWEPILTQPEPIKPVRQTPAQWGKSLEEQAAAFKAAKAAGSEEPVPSPAARNATAEAPPVDEPAPTATPGAAPTTEPTTPSEGDVVTRLTDSLTAAGKVRPEQDYLTSKARSERLAAAREALKTGGVAGYRRAMAQLAGEVPKADFEAVAPKFSADDMDELVNRVSNSPKLQGYETIGALQGLDKLMNGKLPAANELAKLGKVFDDKFLKAALSNRTTTQKGMNLFSQVWNLPRSIVSTLDASIPLRQGVFMVSRPEFYTSFGQMLKQMGSQKYFDATQEALRARPTFQLMDESGLAIHDKRMLETRPEQFRSDLAGKIPVFKHLHNISERGAEGFSNQLRADVFDRLHTQYKRVGIDLAEQPELAKRVANYINIATGRGKVPFDKVGTAVGDILFSPQLMSSRIQLVTLPAKIIAEKDPILRRNMMRDLVGFSSIAATVIALAKLNGAEVSNNPLSTDWGKIKVLSKGGAAGVAEMAPTLLGVGVQQFKGETRYDIFGGMQQYLHLAAVLAMNERTMTNGRTIEFGKGYKPETRASTFFRFLRSKESPAASFINDAMEGTDYIGNKFDLKNALVSRLIPFSAQDIVTGYSPDTNAGPGKTAPAAVQPPANTGTTEVPDWASDKPQEAVNPRLIDNKVAENLLVSTLGLTPTDAGIRTHANQKKYYELARGHGVSRPGHSPHEKGNAIDIAIPSDVSPDDIVKLMKDNGYDGVRVITKKHGTGAHWHIEWASLYD